MKKEELDKLFESCVLEYEDFDYDKYQETIEAQNGAWFYYNNQERNDVYDESMIDYMKEHGFIVYDDPFCETQFDGTGWVVFPPKEQE